MAMTGGSQPTMRAVENDALIESSFRRLLASIEAEREKIRSTWQQIEQEREGTTSELERLRQETEDWCYRERQKIDAEWNRLNRLNERMSVLWPSDKDRDAFSNEVIQVNCSGRPFTIQKSTLCSVEGSYLNHMFSDAFVQNIPRDSEGRYYLDFNPNCFGLIIEYLQNRHLRADSPIPVIPMEQKQNMDLLAEALRLKPFLLENRVSSVHGTSLQVTPGTNMIRATHPGWQIVASQHPMPMAGSSYFEVKIISNPDPVRGGLAVGLCGHVPQGAEVHTIRLADSVMYNSSNGLVGDAFAGHDVAKGVQLTEGSTIGVKHDLATRSLVWYHNRNPIGSSMLKAESLERMRTLYPVFALYVPDMKIQVDFTVPAPSQGGKAERGAGGG